jgi:hypothetical protein
MKKFLNLLLVLCLMSIYLSACSQPVKGDPEKQKQVDSFENLTSGLQTPDYFSDGTMKARQEGDFDPNQYFTVLTHLRLQEGYVLDFIYSSDPMGGYPVVYARLKDAAPFTEGSEYTDWIFENFGEVKNRSEVYFNFILTDDTAEGYFELALLYMLNGKFYLVWHANYLDSEVIADISGFEALKQRLTGTGFGLTLPQDVVEKASKLDFTPVIELTEGKATVKLIYFTKWGGFIQATFTFSRPDGKLQDAQYETLVEYDCGIMF